MRNCNPYCWVGGTAWRVKYLYKRGCLLRQYVPGQKGSCYSISVVGGTPRRQAFSIKCRISYLWHACGAFPVGVFSKQELSHSLRCSEHIIMESNSRLRPRGCIIADVQLETAIISRRHKTNLRPLSSSL